MWKYVPDSLHTRARAKSPWGQHNGGHCRWSRPWRKRGCNCSDVKPFTQRYRRLTSYRKSEWFESVAIETEFILTDLNRNNWIAPTLQREHLPILLRIRIVRNSATLEPFHWSRSLQTSNVLHFSAWVSRGPTLDSWWSHRFHADKLCL